MAESDDESASKPQLPSTFSPTLLARVASRNAAGQTVALLFSTKRMAIADYPSEDSQQVRGFLAWIKLYSDFILHTSF
nr:hypothetical protein [uncultured Noviherbaspirillum sp.]